MATNNTELTFNNISNWPVQIRYQNHYKTYGNLPVSNIDHIVQPNDHYSIVNNSTTGFLDIRYLDGKNPTFGYLNMWHDQKFSQLFIFTNTGIKFGTVGKNSLSENLGTTNSEFKRI